MRHDNIPPVSRDTRHPGAMPRFMRLYDMSGYKVGKGDPDVRGWHVKTADGQTAGRVDSLIVDTEAMQVRYLDVELDRKTFKLDEERHVLVPLASARLDNDHDHVLFDTMNAVEVASLQPYAPGQPINPDAAPAHRQADTDRFYGRRGGTGAVARTAQGPGDDVPAQPRQAPGTTPRDADRPLR